MLKNKTLQKESFLKVAELLAESQHFVTFGVCKLDLSIGCPSEMDYNFYGKSSGVCVEVNTG